MTREHPLTALWLRNDPERCPKELTPSGYANFRRLLGGALPVFDARKSLGSPESASHGIPFRNRADRCEPRKQCSTGSRKWLACWSQGI